MILTSLKERHSGGWEWEATDEGRALRYRTDRDYEGHWIWIDDGLNQFWRQLAGHLQAKYPADRGMMIRRLASEGFDVSGVAPATCGQPWVAEIELCPRCGQSAAAHRA